VDQWCYWGFQGTLLGVPQFLVQPEVWEDVINGSYGIEQVFQSVMRWSIGHQSCALVLQPRHALSAKRPYFITAVECHTLFSILKKRKQYMKV
jgi:hypothetical protein